MADVQKGSPAEKFGLKRGDVIISVGDSKVKNSEDVVFAVRNRLAGEKVPFEIYRDGKKMTVEVTLGDMDSVPGARRQSSSSRGGQQSAPKESTRMGITVVLNSPEFSKQYELSETDGVVVTKIAQGSQGQRLGLRPGDVILEINRQKINSIADWERMMSAKKGALGFLVSRDGQTLFISVGK